MSGYNPTFPPPPIAMDATPQTRPETAATDNRWLRRFTYLVIVATFSLIAIGGKVTSYEYGMAIEQGWTTGGWLSFLAPLEHWWHDIDKRWEHTHRIMGTLVGFLTIAMTAWLWHTQRERPWLRWSGLAMLVMVGLQGYMGATRVSEVSLTRAFIHGIGGQLILCSWVLIAVALSRPWLARLGNIAKCKREFAMPNIRWAVRLLLILFLAQLTLGSAVRHFKADKSPPDMLIYGQVLPPMSQESLDERYTAYYAEQADVTPEESGITNRSPQGEIVVSLSDVDLQMSHRLGAMIVSVFAIGVVVVVLGQEKNRPLVLAPSLVLLMLLGTQVALGVMTVLSETDPILATLHQSIGATLIAVATWLAVRIHLAEYAAPPANADRGDSKAANATPQNSTTIDPAAAGPTPATA